jgi:hypothetical protein
VEFATRRSPVPLPPLPRRHRLWISPQVFLPFSRFRLQPFQHRICWPILPLPPAPALFDEYLIDVGAIGCSLSARVPGTCRDHKS